MPAKERPPSGSERERCETGIDQLDNILDGGIPRGNTVLITGGVGTGKTSLCLEFLVHGAINGEPSLYVSVTEASDKLLQNIIPYDFFDTKLIKESKLKFIDLPWLYEKLGLESAEFDFEEVNILVDAVARLVDGLKVRRLVIDSVTSVAYRLRSRETIRDLILKLASALGRRNCTSLFVSEVTPGEEKYSLYGVEEAIADGVIVTGNLERRGDLLRTLQVVKMRGTQHSRAKYVLDLTTAGVLLVPLLKGGSVAAGGG